MTDQEFLDTFITERMRMHSSAQPSQTDDEIAAEFQLEDEYNHALENLPPEAAAAIKNYHKNITDKLTEETVFFYCKGIKDGLLLYRSLEKM